MDKLSATGPRTSVVEVDESGLAFERTPALLGTASADGYFTSLNPAWEEALGISTEDLMSRPFIEFVHPSDREATMAEAARLSDGGPVLDFANRYATGDGGWRRVSWRAEMKDGSYYFAARDITEEVPANGITALLSPRECEVLQLAADGLSAPQISKRLILSLSTVKTHFEHAYRKLEVTDRPAAVATALRGGVIR